MGGLFNKKEEQKEGDAHPLDDTLRRLLSKLQVYHSISRPTPTVSLLYSPFLMHYCIRAALRWVAQNVRA